MDMGNGNETNGIMFLWVKINKMVFFYIRTDYDSKNFSLPSKPKWLTLGSLKLLYLGLRVVINGNLKQRELTISFFMSFIFFLLLSLILLLFFHFIFSLV